MVALPLLDVFLASDQPADRQQLIAEQLVEAALAELQRIEMLDKNFMPVDARFDPQAAALLIGIYDEWARQAEGLEDRLARLAGRSINVPGAALLRDAHGRVRAMLSVPLEHIEEAEADLNAGRMLSVQEVRRELGLGIH